MDHDWIVFLDLDSFQLPEDCSDQLRRVTTQLEVQTRIARQGEAVYFVQVPTVCQRCFG